MSNRGVGTLSQTGDALATAKPEPAVSDTLEVTPADGSNAGDSQSGADCQLREKKDEKDIMAVFGERLIERFGEDRLVTMEYVRANWEPAFGCASGRPAGVSNSCDASPFVAASLDEAIWMARSGYPSAELIDIVDSLSLAELESLVIKSEFMMLATLLASRYADEGDEKKAETAFILSKIFASKIQPLATAHYVYRATDLLAAGSSKPSRADALRAM